MYRYTIAALLMICVADAASAPRSLVSSQIELGRSLFQDKNLSLDRSVACASCHIEANAFTDSRPVSTGIAQRHGTRNAPSLLDLDSYTAYFWDGRVKTLEEQVLFPLLSATEMGLAEPADVLARIRENPDYLKAFKKLNDVAPEALQVSDVAQAISSYELSLTAVPTRVDNYLSGALSALSAAEQEGLTLFRGKADCAQCHQIGARSAPLTDNDYHSSGIGMHAIAPKLSKLAHRLSQMPTLERYKEAQTDTEVAALGRYLVTLDPKDIGKFRTPSLRNVSRTAPYMHDGSVDTLEKAVDTELYYRGLDRGYPIILSDVEKRALLSFLRALSITETVSENAAPKRAQNENVK